MRQAGLRGGRSFDMGTSGARRRPLGTHRHEPGQNGSLDYRRVSERADDGDEWCIQLIDRSIEVWSTLIVDLVHLYDPERVVLGGGIARNEDIVGRLKRALDEDPWSKDWRVPIEATQLGNDAALLAASSLLRSSAHHQSPEVVL